jgi:hypothetical protein
MNIIERITQTIAKEFGPTYAVVVYMALCEFQPKEIDLKEYGSIACNRLKDMQQIGNDENN